MSGKEAIPWREEELMYSAKSRLSVGGLMISEATMSTWLADSKIEGGN